jgi:16S rRNA (cytosine967-C5)-methyltransferase
VNSIEKPNVTIHRHLVDSLAAALLDVFQQNRYADKVIEYYFKNNRKWGSRDRKFFAESLYEMVRHWRKLQWLTFGQEKAELNARDVVQMWAIWRQENGEQVPDWPELFGLTIKKDYQQAVNANIALRESFPDWMMKRAEAELRNRWESMIPVLNKKAEVYLRTNTLKIKRDDLLKTLSLEGVNAVPVPEIKDGIVLSERKNVFSLEAFTKGFFEVQDASSQMIAPFVQVEPGMRVVDACAGAGGKSLHIAALMQNKGKIIAMDIHEWKLKELAQRSRRASVDIIETRVIESSKTIKRLAETADRVLLDVPCSGMGVIRRNPDTKWKLSSEEIGRLTQLQAELLQNYSKMVKVGGKLIYATCSVLPSENEKQIETFLGAQEGGWILEETLRLDPDKTGFDGFFAARLLRK